MPLLDGLSHSVQALLLSLFVDLMVMAVEPLYKSLGRMYAEFRELEESLRRFACSAMQKGYLGTATSQWSTFGRLVYVASDLASHNEFLSFQRSELKALFDEIWAAWRRRDELALSFWVRQLSELGTLRPLNLLIGGNETLSSQEALANQLDQFSKELTHLSRELKTLQRWLPILEF